MPVPSQAGREQGCQSRGACSPLREIFPAGTRGTQVLVQKVSKHCQLLFGAVALKGDPAKKVTGWNKLNLKQLWFEMIFWVCQLCQKLTHVRAARSLG